MANTNISHPMVPKPTDPGHAILPATYDGVLKWGPWLKRKSRVLENGVTYIGRLTESEHELPDTHDSDLPVNEDILVADQYMSRRSAMLSVTGDGQFKLTFLRASNKAFFNGKEMLMSESIYLNDGDQFKLGHTLFTFRLIKND